MKRAVLILIGLVVLSLLSVGGFWTYRNYFSKETQTSPAKPVSLDPQKEATHLSKVAGEKDAYWMRGFDIVWNVIEPEKGKYSWEESDQMLMEFKDGQAQGAYHLSIIWPYANWDQQTCHTEEKYLATGHLKRGGEDLYMGAPCDMAAYSEFIGKVVERYDGDGRDDMPNLKIPVKHWEIINEPSMQGGSTGGAGEDLKFFVGTSKEYFEVLKTSYEAIKKADPQAKVLHAGMAGMHKNFVDFWTPIFELGAGKYFDIANIHSISTTSEQEDLYVLKFKEFLKKFGLSDKPIWVTEAQFGELQKKPENTEEFDKLVARSSVFALAQGADKLFLIENWVTWGDEDAFKPPEEKGKKEPPPKIDLSGSSTHKVYLNLVDKVNNFERIEKIKEKYTEGKEDWQGATSQVGQYKFINGDESVYVLWGKASVPSEIKGVVTVTDVWGNKKEINASKITLTNSPIFIEIKK